ncbi:hypothetical protein [Planktothrix paucivesiculata]|uniref:Uncharacterized protein n=1 Tax=Planktothrix paucivesiculata PCC 9631 TaxID=671071 RepID=A0A7Z9E3Y8_9CYAN|nr:hypothetical protein [Planktothrix paucivesiculata]VXD22061.1 conserved membrane hypothetical protein [Planktothrix paucivesiculata PCC 9631]
MIDLTTLAEFSRNNCLGICAFLIPFNLLATLQTLIFIGLNRPSSQILLISGFASLYSGLMVLHVFSWFMIGVVMIPTYILLSLGTTCLVINIWAIKSPNNLKYFIKKTVSLAQKIMSKFQNPAFN